MTRSTSWRHCRGTAGRGWRSAPLCDCAVAETGNAVVIGGMVLSVGFAAVTVSSVPVLAGFGLLACAAVAAATVAELVFLPALLVVTDGLVQPRRELVRDGLFGPTPQTWRPAKEAA